MPPKSPRKPGRPRGEGTQARRVFAIFERLLRGARIRPVVLAEELKVNKRTVQRAIDIIRDGRPDLSEEKRDGFVEYYLPNARSSMLELRHALAIFLGAQLVEFVSGPGLALDAKPIVDVLRAQMSAGDRRRFAAWPRRVAVIAPGQRTYRERPELLRELEHLLFAMRDLRPVSLTYHSPRRMRADLLARRLRVHPLGIVFYRDGVYFIVEVLGGDWEADAPKRILLALDRLRDVVVERDSKLKLTLPADFDAAAFFGDAFGIWRDGNRLDVVLQVAAEYAPFVEERRLHRSQKIEQQTDGSLIVRMSVEGLYEVTEWVLSAGEHVEVLAPPELRDRVRQRLAQALALYD